MKSLLLLFSIFLIYTPTIAQQLPLFTQYREYHALLNPAAINSDFFLYEHNLSTGGSYRNQWLKLGDSAPTNFAIKAEYIYNKNRKVPLFFGAHFLTDAIGPIQTKGVYGRIGGLLFSNEPSDGALTIGLSVGRVWQRINQNKVRFNDGSTIPPEVTNLPYWDFGLGIYWYKYMYSGFLEGDNIYMGFSVPQLTTIQEKEVLLGEPTLNRTPHYYLQLGWYKYLNEDSFIEPSIWLKYVVGSGFQCDVNARYHFTNNFFFGLGFSTAKILNLELGMLLGQSMWPDSNLKIGYAFSQYYNNGLHAYFGNTHEVNVTFTIDTVGKY